VTCLWCLEKTKWRKFPYFFTLVIYPPEAKIPNPNYLDSGCLQYSIGQLILAEQFCRDKNLSEIKAEIESGQNPVQIQQTVEKFVKGIIGQVNNLAIFYN
jgi:hypothetical protein